MPNVETFNHSTIAVKGAVLTFHNGSPKDEPIINIRLEEPVEEIYLTLDEAEELLVKIQNVVTSVRNSRRVPE